MKLYDENTGEEKFKKANMPGLTWELEGHPKTVSKIQNILNNSDFGKVNDYPHDIHLRLIEMCSKPFIKTKEINN